MRRSLGIFMIIALLLTGCGAVDANASEHMRAILRLPNGEIVDGNCSYYYTHVWYETGIESTEVTIDGVVYIVPIGSTDLVIIKD